LDSSKKAGPRRYRLVPTRAALAGGVKVKRMRLAPALHAQLADTDIRSNLKR
jgi:hypothetical protein